MIEKIQCKLTRINELDSNKPRKKITILGAGMAGLAAAYELKRLGHDVVIYEANDRVGGRAWTYRFKDGQYHEFGAMRFHTEHDYTRYYANKCGIKFRPFINHHEDPDTYYFIKGVHLKHSEWDLKLLPELELTEYEKWIIYEGGPFKKPEDKHKQLLNLLIYPLIQIVEQVKANKSDLDALLGIGPLTMGIKEIDKISLGDYLRQFLTSKDALDLIGAITGLEVWWDKAVTMFVRDEIAQELRIKDQDIASGLDEMIGGTDLLPNQLSEMILKMGVEIKMNHAISSIVKQRDGNIQIVVEHLGEKQIIDNDYVICTLPYSILRRIYLSGLSKGKMSAIRNLNYASSTKVLLNTKNRFWENQNITGGGTQTDLINRQVYYPSDNFKGAETLQDDSLPKNVFALSRSFEKGLVEEMEVKNVSGVLVGSYCWGQDARRLGGLEREERAKVVIDAISNIHPEILEAGMVKDESYKASIFWDDYKFAGGAFCFMKPSDFSNYYSDTIKPEGNLFFAGEHCSLDQGWIQGAIISSLRAVEEIVQK